jgi:hypothetical protein
VAGAALFGAAVKGAAAAAPTVAGEPWAAAPAPDASCRICRSMSPTVLPKRSDWSLNTAPLPGPDGVTATSASPVTSAGVLVVDLTVKVTASELPSLLFSAWVTLGLAPKRAAT